MGRDSAEVRLLKHSVAAQKQVLGELRERIEALESAAQDALGFLNHSHNKTVEICGVRRSDIVSTLLRVLGEPADPESSKP